MANYYGFTRTNYFAVKDEEKLRELYQEMDSPELEDLIQQGVYLSSLIGRSMD